MLDFTGASSAKRVTIEEIDFQKVEEAKDVKTLEQYLKILVDDGSHYVQLENEIKKKIVELDPKQKAKYFPESFTAEKEAEKAAVNKWVQEKLAAAKNTDGTSTSGSTSGGVRRTAADDKVQAEVTRLKNEGNERHSRGEFQAAIDKFTQAIAEANKAGTIAVGQKLHSILYSNRAQVYIELRNFGDALCDAETAIKVDPSNIKANFRIAYSLCQLERDLERAQTLAGHVLDVYRTVGAPATEAEELIKTIKAKIDATPSVTPVIDASKTSAAPSSKPFSFNAAVRVEASAEDKEAVKEAPTASVAAAPVPVAAAVPKKVAVAKPKAQKEEPKAKIYEIDSDDESSSDEEEDVKEEVVAAEAPAATPEVPAPVAEAAPAAPVVAKKTLVIEEVEEDEEEEEAVEDKKDSTTNANDDVKATAEDVDGEMIDLESRPSAPTQTLPSSYLADPSLADLMVPPETILQLETTLKTLKNAPATAGSTAQESIWAYLSTCMSPAVVRRLFAKLSIDPDLLGAICQHWVDAKDKGWFDKDESAATGGETRMHHAASCLHAMLSCEGMDTVMLLIEDKDAQKLRRAVNALKAAMPELEAKYNEIAM